MHENLEALLLLGTELLEHGARFGTCLEVALVSGQLNPWIALLLVRLKEGCPLDDVANLSPAGALQESWLNRLLKRMLEKSAFLLLILQVCKVCENNTLNQLVNSS